MTKDSEYTSKAGMFEELYGKAMQATSTHVFTNQGKALKYLSNELFLAAKADLREDAKNLEEAPSTTNLDIFYNRLGKKIGKTGEEVKKILNKATNKNQKPFKKIYEDLKAKLKEDRVLGVGKTNEEKAKTLAKNSLKAAMTIGRTILNTIPSFALYMAKESIDLRRLNRQRLTPFREQTELGKQRGAIENFLSEKLPIPKTEGNKDVLSTPIWKKPPTQQL